MAKSDNKKPDPNSPFAKLQSLRAGLGEQERDKAEAEKKLRAQAQKRIALASEESDLLAQAMAGVRRIDQVPPKPRKKQPLETGKIVPKHPSDDAEVLQQLENLVAGRAPMDFTDSDGFIEGRAEDCSRLNLMKLRNAEFTVQSSVDLHGKNREEARAALVVFFAESLKRGFRCVHVICGRGLHTPGGIPVLKELLVRWLIAGTLSHSVLAFSSAKSHDGGVGAVYILLRKNPRRG